MSNLIKLKGVNLPQILLIGLVFTFLFSVTFSPTATAQEKTYQFYLVSHGGPSHPFWGTVIRGMKDADKQLDTENVEVNAQWLGPETYTIEKYLSFIEQAIAGNPDGIAFAPPVWKAADSAIRRAMDKGIPVTAFNVPDTRPPGERVPYKAYVGQTEYEAGMTAGKRLLEEFEEPPKRVALATNEPGSSWSEQRTGGLKDALKEAGVEKVDKVATKHNKEQTIGVIEAYLKRHEDTEAIVPVELLSAQAIHTFLKEEDRTDEITMGTFDLADWVLNGIENGSLAFTVDQQPYLQGYYSVLYLYQIARYGFNPPDAATGPAIVDKDNIDAVKEGVEKEIR